MVQCITLQDMSAKQYVGSGATLDMSALCYAVILITSKGTRVSKSFSKFHLQSQSTAVPTIPFILFNRPYLNLLLLLVTPPLLKVKVLGRLQSAAQSLGGLLDGRILAAELRPQLQLQELRLERLDVEHEAVPRRNHHALQAVPRGRDGETRERGGGEHREEAKARFLRTLRGQLFAGCLDLKGGSEDPRGLSW